MAVIELGAVRPDPPVHPEPVRPRGIRRLRPLALALSAALLLGAGGAAPPAAPELTLIGRLPTGPDAQYLFTRDRLYVSYVTPDRTAHLLTAYDLRDGRPRWQVRQVQVIISVQQLQHAGNVLLTRTFDRYGGGPQITALDDRTGERRWSLPYDVTVLADGRTGLATIPVLPGPAAQAGRPDWQLRYEGHADDGSLSSVKAIDLASGEELWTAPRVAHVRAVTPGPGAGPGAGPGLLVIPERGPIEVWDSRTRVVLHRLAPPTGGPVEVNLVQKLLMVHPPRSPRLTVYQMGTLRALWTKPSADPEPQVNSCGSLLCQLEPVGGVTMLDPATGTALWTRSNPPVLVEEAGHLIELTDSYQATRTIDPRTGRTLIDLAPWLIRPPFPVLPDTGAPVLLTRPATGGAGVRTWLAALEPGSAAVRLLGLAPQATVNCQAGPSGHFVCYTGPSELLLWRYRR